MSDTTITAEERAELRRILSMRTSSVDGCGLFYRETPRLLNALEQAEAQLAAALQVNAARQAEVTADVLNAMMAGITGQKESVRVEVEGFQCPYCNEISKTIEAATAHDAICPKHPAVIRAEKSEAENARLTKMVDWLAGRELTVDGFAAPCQCESDYFQGKKAPCGERPDEFCSKFNHRGNGACWVEAARRAVADSEVKG